MSRPIRTEPYDLRAAILTTAWRLITEKGSETLSLRAIGRELNVTAPAIYNYFPRFSDLISTLVAQAGYVLGAFINDAFSPHLEDDANIQLRIVCQAYRRWAIENPELFQFIFSNPVMESKAIITKNKNAVSPSLNLLISILDAAHRTDQIKKESRLVLPPGLNLPMQEWKQTFMIENENTLYLAVIIWSRMHGLVMNEIENRYPPFIKDPGEFYRFEVKTMINQYLG